MPTKKSYLDIYTDGKTRIKNNTPITNFSSTGVINNLLHAHALEVEEVYNTIERLYTAFDPTRANSSDLDVLGYLVGATRQSPTVPLDISYTNFFFYLDPGLTSGVSGLFSSLDLSLDLRQRLFDNDYINDVNSPSEILIPAGVSVSTKDESITYKTMTPVLITNSNTEGYTPVIGTLEGPYQNVDSNQLVKHSLLTDSIFTQVARYILCSNRYPISSGKNSLSDNEFRYNVSINSKNKIDNEIAVRQAAISVPGVRNILFERGRFGNGSINIIVEGINPLVSDGLVEVVRQRVQSLFTGSEKIFVSKPIYRGINIKFDVLVGIGSDVNTIKELTRTAVINYINDIPLGGVFIYNEFIERAMAISGVKDIVINSMKIGEYDAFNKYITNQVLINNTNQKTLYNQKFYTDSGLIEVCCNQG